MLILHTELIIITKKKNLNHNIHNFVSTRQALQSNIKVENEIKRKKRTANFDRIKESSDQWWHYFTVQAWTHTIQCRHSLSLCCRSPSGEVITNVHKASGSLSYSTWGTTAAWGYRTRGKNWHRTKSKSLHIHDTQIVKRKMMQTQPWNINMCTTSLSVLVCLSVSFSLTHTKSHTHTHTHMRACAFAHTHTTRMIYTPTYKSIHLSNLHLSLPSYQLPLTTSTNHPTDLFPSHTTDPTGYHIFLIPSISECAWESEKRERVHVCVLVCDVHVYVHFCVGMCVCMHVQMSICKCVCVRERKSVCVCVSFYIYIYGSFSGKVYHKHYMKAKN